MDKKTAFFLGFAITISAMVISEIIADVMNTKPDIEVFPDLDEVTKWRLHREAEQILRDGA